MTRTDVAARFRLAEILAARKAPITQTEIARESGISHVTVRAVLRNSTTRVDLKTLDAIARAVGVEPGDLIERVPEAPPPAPRATGKRARAK